MPSPQSRGLREAHIWQLERIADKLKFGILRAVDKLDPCLGIRAELVSVHGTTQLYARALGTAISCNEM